MHLLVSSINRTLLLIYILFQRTLNNFKMQYIGISPCGYSNKCIKSIYNLSNASDELFTSWLLVYRPEIFIHRLTEYK